METYRLGGTFKAWRQGAPTKLSQTAAAKALGVTQQTVSGWETDTAPGAALAPRIEDLYGLPRGAVMAVLFPEAYPVTPEIEQAIRSGQTVDDRFEAYERRLARIEDLLRTRGILDDDLGPDIERSRAQLAHVYSELADRRAGISSTITPRQAEHDLEVADDEVELRAADTGNPDVRIVRPSKGPRPADDGPDPTAPDEERS